MRVAVVGSCMMDLVARVPRHPEPGETLLGREFGMFIGGKGLNQAVAARRLGADVTLIGRVGEDVFGDQILAFLETEGVDAIHVARDPANGTGVALPLVYDDGGNSIISVPRANLAMTAADIDSAANAIRSADVLLIQFEVGMSAIIAAVGLASGSGVRVVLNTAPIVPFPAELRGIADTLVANELEAAALAPGSPEGVEAQAQAFLEGNTSLAIVTLGAAGAFFASTTGAAVHVPSFTVDAIDSVGAGDAFCAALAVGLAGGEEPGAAIRFASAAGALATTRRGAAPSLPGRAEVERLLGL